MNDAARFRFLGSCLLAAGLLGALPAHAQSVIGTIAAGAEPRALAVDMAANRVYVANEGSGTVTVVEGDSGATREVAVGRRPQHIAVNPATGRVYVSNASDSSLSVIDRATLGASTLPIGGTGPIVIDETINRIYVVRTGKADEVTYVDGNANAWYTIATDSFSPVALDVNRHTRRLYVAHYATGDLRAVDTTSPSDHPPTVSIGVWSKPVAVAVNPATNRIYALTEDSRGPIVVIDGDSNAPTFLAPAGHAVGPRALAVNAHTNRIYAGFADEVIVVDGATNAMTFIPTAGPVVAIAVNATANRIYALTSAGSVSVIDGATNAVTTVPVPPGARAIAVNPVTNRAYVAGPGGVTVIAGVGASGLPPPLPPPPPPRFGLNVHGMWWASPGGSESGWGIDVAHQGNTLFVTWFTYDLDGQPLWLVMSNGARNGENSYIGDLYRSTGPALGAPFDASKVKLTKVGVATLSFSDANNGNLTARVDGQQVAKKITRHVFATPMPACSAGGAPGTVPNYQDLWWNAPAGSEPGWGVHITHQGDTLFVAWFTYGPDGRGLWLVGSSVAKTGNGTYAGTLYRAAGPPFNRAPWDASQVRLTPAGSITLTFPDERSGTMAYTVDGVPGTKAITRTEFSSPATVCR